MKTEELVIDCDGHILEPPDLWEKYIDPKYRERAMRIRVGDDGFEYLEIDNKRAKMTQPGLLASLGGMGKKVEDAARSRDEWRHNQAGAGAHDGAEARGNLPQGRGVRHHGHEGTHRSAQA